MKHIIIADHHRVVREALLPIIAHRAGMRVHSVAGNLDELCRCLRQQPLDCLVMDLNLPPAGGLEAARRALRLIHRENPIPEAALSEARQRLHIPALQALLPSYPPALA